MKILAIDTSSNICSVAILDDLNILYEYSSNDGLTHSQNLMPMIDEAFKKTSLSLKDIDLYSCSIGPGSFTGIRIGVSTVKAFVDVYSKPSIGISSLEGLSYNLDSEYVCSIIDAKHDNVYYALFKKDKATNGYSLLTDLCATSIDFCLLELSQFGNNTINFVGDGALIYKDKILDKFKNSILASEDLNNQNAVSIGKAAYIKYINNISSSSLSPLYLKKSQAEMMLDKNN